MKWADRLISHLFDLISNDLDSVVDESELLPITQNKPEFEDLNLKYANKVFMDVVRLANSTNS